MKLFKRLIFKLIRIFFALLFIFKKVFLKKKKRKIGFLTDEFFHEDLGGFGGYGKTVKNITDHFNTNGKSLRASVILTKKLDIPISQIKPYHKAQVILDSQTPQNYVVNFLKYARLLNKEEIELFITIEYYYLYEEILNNFPAIPCLIWIKDPRDETEWRNIGEVSLEIKVYKKNTPDGLLELLNGDRDSIKRLVYNKNIFNRKVIFATQAHSLVEIAKRAYGLDNINPIFLPNPIEMPQIEKPTYSAKPSVLFLGRLEPIKRPWIFFELARRFSHVDFFVAGKTHFPDLMNPIIEKYQNISNLKFLGLITGKELDNLLNNVWGVINTSVHEALPVSFLEAFSYFKPIISCQNPDDLVNKFGVYTGEILGEGFDNKTIDKFTYALETFLSKKFDRETIGISARRYVETTHSFSNYERIINEVLDKV